MKKIKIAVLPGDGIGAEVMDAALPIFNLLNVPVELNFGDVGWTFWRNEGNALPERTWQIIKQSEVTLLGAITSKPEREANNELSSALSPTKFHYVSPVIQLRQGLDLYANIRPCFDISGNGNFNFCVIRENTEGLYAGLDFHPVTNNLKTVIEEKKIFKDIANDKLSCALRVQSELGLMRLFELAFSYADKNGHQKVTFADKPNVLRNSGAFAREIYEKVASKYNHIKAEILNVDAVALWLVRAPEKFGVIVAENMFGDILSDVGAAVMGGLGFAPSANIGNNGCYFEPVHGSAPAIKSNRANPSAMFLTIGLLLKNFGYIDEATKIKNAVIAVVKNTEKVTYDLGGDATTTEMAKAILEQCLKTRVKKSISFISTGSEIINGEICDINAKQFAEIIYSKGGDIYQHLHVSDKKAEIETALNYTLGKSDAIVITGGLGPTSDDCTRYAIANVAHQELVFNEAAWEHIKNRLTKFNLKISESNKQQALFPRNSVTISNENGTAFGCYLQVGNKDIYMLPGPPKESLPMLNNFVLTKLNENGFLIKKNNGRWLTMGLIEGEIAPIIDEITKKAGGIPGYRWHYPYIEIKILDIPEQTLDTITLTVNELLAPNLISTDGKTAREIFDVEYANLHVDINIYDSISNDFLMNEFKNYKHLFFNKSDVNINNIVFSISSSKPILGDAHECGGTISFSCSGYYNGDMILNHAISTPWRGKEIFDFTKSYFAWQLSVFIKKLNLEKNV